MSVSNTLLFSQGKCLCTSAIIPPGVSPAWAQVSKDQTLQTADLVTVMSRISENSNISAFYSRWKNFSVTCCTLPQMHLSNSYSKTYFSSPGEAGLNEKKSRNAERYWRGLAVAPIFCVTLRKFVPRRTEVLQTYPIAKVDQPKL
eukprot:g55190.t1